MILMMLIQHDHQLVGYGIFLLDLQVKENVELRELIQIQAHHYTEQIQTQKFKKSSKFKKIITTYFIMFTILLIDYYV